MSASSLRILTLPRSVRLRPCHALVDLTLRIPNGSRLSVAGAPFPRGGWWPAGRTAPIGSSGAGPNGKRRILPMGIGRCQCADPRIWLPRPRPPIRGPDGGISTLVGRGDGLRVIVATDLLFDGLIGALMSDPGSATSGRQSENRRTCMHLRWFCPFDCPLPQLLFYFKSPKRRESG